ncbi:MAG: lipid A export permease/ATP-binding protein MsbA [Pseudomonadota bacterium]
MPQKQIALLAVVAMIVMALTAPVLPALMKPLMDGGFVNKDPFIITWMPFFLVGLFFIRGIASYVGNASLHWVGTRIIMDLRQQMFNKLIDCPTPFYDDQRTGNLISRFTFDVLQIKEAATNAVTTLIRDSLTIFGLLAWMFYIDWLLATICLFGAPLIGIVVSIIRKRLRKMSLRVQEAMGNIHHVLNEALDAQKIIKLYGGKNSEKARFEHTANKHRQFANKQIFTAQASSPSVQFITAIFLAIIVFMATRQATEQDFSVGDFTSFFTAMAMLLDPLKRLAGVNEHLQKGLAACDTVFTLIDSEAEHDNGTKTLENPHGKIEFNNVSFTYTESDQSALSNVSFNIEPGETVALVGESGSGKTTIANLLPRFYEIQEGNIYYDEHNIRDLTLTSLRQHIALVSQDVVLFNDTVRNNIAYGELQDADEADIEKAIVAAHASEFIDALPEKLNTMLGEDGMRLSGGQRQRLAIARAILKNSRLLILDEATSALDSNTEQHIQSAMENVKKGRTCLIIAHRLSTIENADRIIVMDNRCAMIKQVRPFLTFSIAD